MFVKVEPDASWKVRVLANTVERQMGGGLVFNDVGSYCLEFNGDTGDIAIDGISREQAEKLYQALGEHLL